MIGYACTCTEQHDKKDTPNICKQSSEEFSILVVMNLGQSNAIFKLLGLFLGGSRENSDVEDGSPARKRRKTPTRISTRTSSQVTFVPDKEVPGKSTYGSPSKSKGRKQ